MKFSDLTKIFESRSDDWKTEYNKKVKTAIVNAVNGINNIDDAKKVFNWGHFSVDDEEGRRHNPEISEIFKEHPDIKELVLGKFDELVKGGDFVRLLKAFAGSPIFKHTINRNREVFAKFFFDNLTIDDGILSFKHEEIKNFPHHDTILGLMIDEDYDMILEYLKKIISTIPATTINFDFSLGNKRGWGVDGRNAIVVSEKKFIPRLYRAALIAHMLDEYSGTYDAQELLIKSQAYRSFSRSLSNAVKKMTTITEADLYNEEYGLFLSQYACPDFFRTLRDFISLLVDTNKVGKEIFAWFYNLPRHGQVHPEKKKFLDTFQEVMSKSGIFDLIKTDSIFDDGHRLKELAFYD